MVNYVDWFGTSINESIEDMIKRIKKLQKMNTNQKGIHEKLTCPKCKENDKGNKLNGCPWCIKCNIPLESS